ncbi:lipocalin-like domain-containing protein [Sphingobium sp. YR768]|uniref:lipocalin-like domain-containing protein n=1 Tax=Sphingobium sp. YR768 TaxID=1884365 RepID=UPI0008BD4E1A|nr:lipocalin-like domain-containing protein [Sphingobium sp. YR768]SER22836.1 Hydroxyneurosporene synthase (CrtC) [Sphingobium sp. YR768]
MSKAFSPLTFDVRSPVVRSAREEWKPHARMSEKSYEWWYVTVYAYDSSGRSYFLFFDLVNYPGDGWQKRFGHEPVDGHRFVHIVGMVSDYERQDFRQLYEFGYLPDTSLWSEEEHAVKADVGKAKAHWSYGEQHMDLRAEFNDVHLRLRFDNTNEVVWHQDKLGVEGMIQQGAEDDFSFYYSLMRAPTSGRLSLKDANGSWRHLQISGSSWIDRQWGDFYSLTWEWTSFRFDNGARLHLYNFYNGHQEGVYLTADGEVRRFDTAIVRQNGYAKAPKIRTWVSWGWSYEFPIEIEGSRFFTVEPYSAKEFLEVPEIDYALYEGAGRLIDERTRELVGVSVNESADIRKMENGPYGARQR